MQGNSFAELAQKRKARGTTSASRFLSSPASTPNQQQQQPEKQLSVDTQKTVDDAQTLTPASASSSSHASLYRRSKIVEGARELHPALNDLEVREDPVKGRGVWVKKSDNKGKGRDTSIKPGTTLLQIRPNASALSTTYLFSTCYNCCLSIEEVSIVAFAKKNRTVSVFETLKKCAGCGIARFCSKSCQTESWSTTHAVECKGFKRIKKSFITYKEAQLAESSDSATLGQPHDEDLAWLPTAAVRAVGSLVIRRKKEREAAGGKDGAWWRQVASLQSHQMATSADGLPSPHSQLAMHLGMYLGFLYATGNNDDGSKPADMQLFGFRDVGEVLSFCAAFLTNSFTLSSPSLVPIGVAISPTTALFNHSCNPNAVVVFPFGCTQYDGGGMNVVAISEIKPGQEVVTAYIDISMPKDLRRSELKTRYFFDCDCRLCNYEKDGWIDPREALICREAGCGALTCTLSTLRASQSLSLKCPNGHPFVVLPEASSVIFESVERGSTLIGKDAQGHFSHINDFLASGGTEVIDTLSTFLSPTAHPLLSLLSTISTLLISSMEEHGVINGRLLLDALLSRLAVVEANSQVFPSTHPVVGISIASVGKLLLVPTTIEESDKSLLPLRYGKVLPRDDLARMQLAQMSLHRARLILFAGLGSRGGVVGTSVEDTLEGIEREIRLLKQANVEP